MCRSCLCTLEIVKDEVVDDRLLLPFAMRFGATESESWQSPAATQSRCFVLHFSEIIIVNLRNTDVDLEEREKGCTYIHPSGI